MGFTGMSFLGRLYFTWLLIAGLSVPQISLAVAPPLRYHSESSSPVEIEAALIPVGHTGDYIAIAPITNEEAAPVLRDLVRNSPETTVVALSDASDPLAQALSRQPRANEAHVTQAGRVEDNPVFQTLSRSLQQKLKAKIAELNNKTRLEKTNLLISYLSAAIASGTYFLASGNYIAAGGMLGVLTAFNSYLYFFEENWHQVKQYGRSWLIAASDFLARRTGHKLTDRERETFGLYGEFNTTWAANATITATILGLTAGWESFSLQTAVQALVAGFVANVDVWDYSVSRFGQSLMAGARLMQKFVLFRLLMVEILNLMALWNVLPEAQLVFGAIVISGLMWLLAGEKAERKIADRLSRQKRILARCSDFLKTSAFLKAKQRSGI